MPIKVETPSTMQIMQLRQNFQQKLQDNPPAEPFHPVDIERVQNDDLWCTRFLEMYDLDMQVSFNKLWETCIWRQQFGAYDLNENNLCKEYLTDGVVFSHNVDVDGKPILIFRTSLHIKGSKNMDEVIRVVVYWIERIQRERNLEKITIFFDMSNTGLSNMDLDFVKRIIDVFKLYYPNSLNYILVFEMAWVLNAVFKVIKGLLPAKALEILKVISKKELSQYVDKDNSLRHWGGNDDYTFSFLPEKPREADIVKNGSTRMTNGALKAAATTDSADRKVHFATNGDSPTRMKLDYEDHFTPQDHDMLRITPNDFITFERGNESNESTVDISSLSGQPITYKIQTTSPEKFRVRPRCGVLNPGESITVSILLKADHHLAEGSKDKFLVMCTTLFPGTDTTTQKLAESWKQKASRGDDVEQHRLCCIYKGAAEPPLRNGFGRAAVDAVNANGGNSTADLAQHAKKLDEQLRHIQILQTVTLVFLLLLSGAVMYLLKLLIYLDTTESAADEGESAESVQWGQTYNCPKAAGTATNLDLDGGGVSDTDDALGGVAGGGYLLGLIAFTRKFGRFVLSVSMIFCILFFSIYYYIIIQYRVGRHSDITALAALP